MLRIVFFIGLFLTGSVVSVQAQRREIIVNNPFLAEAGNWLLVGIIIALVITLTALLVIIVRHSKKHPVKYHFASRRGRNNAVVFISLLVALAVVLAFSALTNIESKVKKDINAVLHAVLHTTQGGLNIWAKERKSKIRAIASDPQFIQLTEKQLINYQQLVGLRNTSELQQLRRFFGRSLEILGSNGFYVFTPEGVNIAGMQDEAISAINIIQRHRPDLMNKLLDGHEVMIPPIPSDIPVPGARFIADLKVPPSMFFATPVRNREGDMLAILALGFDPHGDFSEITRLGRIGKTGETYAFNKNGLLLSESRFTDQLIAKGTLKEDEQSILSVSIKVPDGEHKAGSDLANSQALLTVMARSATAEISDFNIDGYQDYRGVPVMGAWTWDTELGIGLATEIDVAEAMEGHYNVRGAIIGLFVTSIPLIIIFTFVVMNSGRRAYRALHESQQRLRQRESRCVLDLENANRETEAAKKELQKRQERHRSMVHNIPGVVYTCRFDKEWTMDFISDYIEKISGYPASDFVRNEVRSYASIIYPDDIHIVDDAVDQGIASDGFFEIEYRIVNKNGDISWVFERGQVVRTEHDIVDHLDGFIMDISEHKQHEIELKLVNQKLGRLNEQITILNCVLDNSDSRVFGLNLEDGTLFYINKTGAHLLGYVPQELINVAITEIDPEFSREQRSLFAGPLRNGVPIVVNSEFVFKSGEKCIVEVTYKLVDYGDKNQALAYFKPVTVEK